MAVAQSLGRANPKRFAMLTRWLETRVCARRFSVGTVVEDILPIWNKDADAFRATKRKYQIYE